MSWVYSCLLLVTAIFSYNIVTVLLEYIDLGNLIYLNVTRFEKCRLPCSQQQGWTHFSPSNNSCTRWLTIQPLAARYWCLKLPGLLLLWLFSEAYQTSTSVRVAFKWLHIIPLASRQLAVIHHTTGWWVWPWIYLLCVICGGENDTNRYHLASFGEDRVAFARHFVATLPPCRSVLLVLAIVKTI